MNVEDVKLGAQQVIDAAKITESISSDQLQVAVRNQSFNPQQASFIALLYNNWRLAEWSLDALEVLEKIARNADLSEYDTGYLNADEIAELAKGFIQSDSHGIGG